MQMRLARIGIAILTILVPGGLDSHGAGLGSVTGKVRIKGTPPKAKPLDLSRDPACAKMHAKTPLLSENVVVGPDGALQNVVVYISTGDADPGPPPASPVTLSQQDCRFLNHVVVLRVGQEVSMVNDDPLSHNIHVMAKTNREWNRMQLPGAPPFSYSFSSEEFIPIRCNIHPWMMSYLAVLRPTILKLPERTVRLRCRRTP